MHIVTFTSSLYTVTVASTYILHESKMKHLKGEAYKDRKLKTVSGEANKSLVLAISYFIGR